ncbi:hypothetical protein EVAR_78363_1 [Eumeta japonica]|uniref:Uncharacterized protein n=1 Tax=Eumeta variegata TaxID=151549 RepID=A0A4C1T4I2_EUMVA|nr:hypothetical protein EVAR_78363_1 [Eumeta japonica]
MADVLIGCAESSRVNNRSEPAPAPMDALNRSGSVRNPCAPAAPHRIGRQQVNQSVSNVITGSPRPGPPRSAPRRRGGLKVRVRLEQKRKLGPLEAKAVEQRQLAAPVEDAGWRGPACI